MRVWPEAVIPGAQRACFPIGTFLSKRAIGQMRGFGRSAAADQAGQTTNPNEIGAIALSAGVLGLADHHSTPWAHFRPRRSFWVRCTPGITKSRSRSKARLIPILSASGLWRRYSFGIRDKLSIWTALGQETA
jgi:hypothetical protein